MEEKTIITVKETKRGKSVKINGTAVQVLDSVYAILEGLISADCKDIDILDILDLMLKNLKKEYEDEQAN